MKQTSHATHLIMVIILTLLTGIGGIIWLIIWVSCASSNAKHNREYMARAFTGIPMEQKPVKSNPIGALFIFSCCGIILYKTIMGG